MEHAYQDHARFRGSVGAHFASDLLLSRGCSYLSKRSQDLAVFALTGFANFSSIGIQLGGIGALAPERRSDLAKLGLKALLVGFLATLINAAIAGLLM